MLVLAVSSTDVVVALHVMAVVAAFGIWFAWPLLATGTPEAHEARARAMRVLSERVGALALVSGIYLAVDEGVFGEVWVLVPLAILVVLLGMAGSFVVPRERELAQGQGGAATAAQVDRVVLVGAVLVLVATFFMVTKLG